MKTRTFTLHSNPCHRRKHASRSQSKETAQPTTVSIHSHSDNDPKFAALNCFSLTPPNGVSPAVCGQHTSNRHLAHNHPPHSETDSPTRVRGNDWGSHMHPPCSQNRLTKNMFHRRHWIKGINIQIHACQHGLRQEENNEPQNSKWRPYQCSRKNDAHNRHILPPTQLQFHLLHRRRRRQHSRT